MSETFYTNEAAFDAALQAAGQQPTTFDIPSSADGGYSTAAGYTQSGVNFVGNKQNGYSLGVTGAGYYGNDYPVTSIQGPAPSSSYYGIQNGYTSIQLPNGSYALGMRLFTVHTYDYQGAYTDTVSLTATDSQGNSSTGTGTTASGSSYSSNSGSGFLGVISTAPITAATLTGSTSEDFVDIAEVTYATGAPMSTQSTPTISGTHASTTNAEASVSPFTGVSLGDSSTNASDAVTIQLSDAGAGGTLSGDGLTGGTGGTYQLAAASPSTLTSELDALSFTPASAAPGTQTTTTLTVNVQNANGSISDSATSVTDIASASTTPAPSPTLTPNPTPSPSPTPTPTPSPTPTPPTNSNSDALQITSATIDSTKQITISGFAEGNNGTGGISFSGSINGGPPQTIPAQVTYSGAEDQNGSFTAIYNLGQNTLTSVTATLQDREGGQVSIDLPDNFSGLPGQSGVTHYNPGSDQIASTTHLRSNGSQVVNVKSPDLTIDSGDFATINNAGQQHTTFVFDPGFGIDVVNGFKATGSGHDLLNLPSSDFSNFADVLRNTGDIQGSAWITDPKTGDAIRLAGVTTAELKANRQDFSFHT